MVGGRGRKLGSKAQCEGAQRGPSNRGPVSGLREPVVLCNKLGTYQVGSSGRSSVSLGHRHSQKLLHGAKCFPSWAGRSGVRPSMTWPRSQGSPGPHKVTAMAGWGRSPATGPQPVAGALC